MVFINEWLPNPVGPDAPGEFIEFYNSGSMPASVQGWTIATEAKRRFALPPRIIAPKGYLVVKRPELKLALRNADGGLSLYDAKGRLVDAARFLGSAPEGKSFSRVNYVAGDIAHFAFVDPTPGGANRTINTAVASARYPAGVPLNLGAEAGPFSLFMAGTSLLLAGFILYIIERNEDLSELFFRGNTKTRDKARS